MNQSKAGLTTKENEMETTYRILPSAEWAYPEMEADFRELALAWREVSEQFYTQAREVLPPIYVPCGFMVSEPHTHLSTGEAVYAGFVTVRGRYFARYASIRAFSKDAQDLRHSLNP